MSERLRRWGPDVALGVAVLWMGLLMLQDINKDPVVFVDFHGQLVVLAMAVAVVLFRRAPGIALGLVWIACGAQLLINMPPLLVEAALGLVAFGCARWGSTTTVVLSGASIPASTVVAVGAVATGLYRPFDTLALRQLVGGAFGYGLSGPLVGVAIASLVLGTPWLAGLTVRALERARRSRASQEVAEEDAARAAAEREQAQEIARLREGQARLAGDVHDVVGHSLAVILAQAESGQYLPDDDPARLKHTLATIATSARSSLQDVRQVLATTRGGPRPEVGPGELDELVEGVRRSGHEVLSSEVGQPQPLPPELAEVAYRVLQEMLTNAIRHGRRDTAVRVERHWGGDLRIELVNDVVTTAELEETRPISTVEARVHELTSGDGQGVAGMRGRLESVGGRLDVRRRSDTFTATAWLPVRR